MNWKYFWPDDGETVADAQDLEPPPWQNVYIAEYAAIAVAEQRHSLSSGVWLGCRVGIVDEYGEVTVWDVRGELVMEFTAYPAEEED